LENGSNFIEEKTIIMRDANRVSDEGGSHDQNIEELRDQGDKDRSETVSRESTGGASKVGTGSGNKSGGSGKKAGDDKEETE
jgi:hypothetical protein